jgi:hypothetical protein
MFFELEAGLAVAALAKCSGILLSCYLRKCAQCFSGKSMQLKSSALPNLISRWKLAINPATRLFLVVLFVCGFTSSYFVDLRFKIHPRNAASADVESHPPNPAIVFVRTGGDRVLPLSTPCGPFESRNPHRAPQPPLARNAPTIR